ncbi:MAG: translocation/assembly module TamB [Saprospiraceae bacterium]|nr:translocation/assembly module TamB [Saprospiraceae bacterium]
MSAKENSTSSKQVTKLVHQKKRSFLMRILGGTWKLFKRILVTLFVFLLIIRGLLEIPAVQNWMADRAAEFFSSGLGMRVEIGKMRLGLFTEVSFDEFYIEDTHGDTLMYADEIDAEFDVVTPWNKHLNIGEISAKNAVFHYIKHEGERYFEFQKVIKFFQPKNPAKVRPKHPFRFGITNAKFENFAFRFHDHIKQVRVDIHTPFGTVDGKEVDLIGKYVEVEDVFLDDPQVRVHIEKFDSTVVDTFTYDIKPLHPSFPRWHVLADHLSFENMNFSLRNDRKPADTTRILDFNNMNMYGIYMGVDSFSLEKEVLKGIVHQLEGKEKGGFQVRELTGRAELSSKKLIVKDLKGRTDNSVFKDSLVFEYQTYRDYLDFVNKVKINAKLDGSHFTFRDIAVFSPKILNNPFIKANLDEEIKLNGVLKNSTISKAIRVKDMELDLGDHTHVVGNITLRDIMNPDAAFMHLNVDELNTNIREVRNLLSFTKIPAQFNALNKLQFQGIFIGYFQDFVAEGLLNTSIGQVKSDLHMKIVGGNVKATYDGDLALINFDVGRLTGVKDLGIVTVTSKENFLGKVDVNRKIKGITGRGFDLDNLYAVMAEGIIKQFEFKGYSYENLKIEGLFEGKKFDGKFLSKDKNLDVYLNGLVDLNNELPKIDILGAVRNIDFQELNITPDERVVIQVDSVIVDAEGRDINNFGGKLFFDKIHGFRGDDEYTLNNITMTSKNTETQRRGKIDTLREVHLNSDILRVDVEGHYDAVDLVKSFKKFVQSNYPNFFRDLDYTHLFDSTYTAKTTSILLDSIPIEAQQVNVKIEMKDSKNFTELITKQFKHIKNLSINLDFESESEELKLDGYVGEVQIGNIRIAENLLKGEGKGRVFQLTNEIEGVYIKDSTFLPSFVFDLNALGDTLSFSTEISKLGGAVSGIVLDGKFSFLPGAVQISLDSADLAFLGEPWRIRENNYIRFGKGKLEVHNVRLTNNEQLLELNNKGDKGLGLCLQNINLGWWYDLKPLPKIDLDGKVSSNILVEDLFKLRNLTSHIIFHDLVINGDDWGKMDMYVQSDSLRSKLNAILKHSGPIVDSIYIKGSFLPFFATKKKEDQNRLNFDFDVQGASASIIEYFLPTQLANTDGMLRAVGTLSGVPQRLSIGGNGEIQDLTTTVTSLQTTYYAPEGRIELSNDGFHVRPKLEFDILEDKYESGGVVIYDEEGGEAFVGGAIRHDRLKNFGLEFKIIVPENLSIPNSNKTIKNNFLAMRTTKEDNSTFYGTVYVTNGIMDFYGPFNRLKLIADATTAKNTRLVLPLSDPTDIEEVQFIKFVDRSDTSNVGTIVDDVPEEVGGLDIELSVTVTPEAEAQLIFDERTGDIISGRGEGLLRINYTPSGELNIHGDYEIKEGNYLFTLRQLVNKSFDVKEGGLISWTGDPYNAQIDLQAIYEARVSPYNLVSPYISENPALKSIANQKSDIDILMDITGTLYATDITFEMEVSEQVDPRIRTLINSSLGNMGINELNRQVFGAIIFQQFLPQDNIDGQGLDLVSTTVNTLTEMLSQQLNNHINDLLSQVLSDVEGVDLMVDLGINLSDNAVSSLDDVQNSDAQVRLALDPTFLDGKLKVHIGGTADIGGNSLNVDGNAQYFGGDFTIEYQLTENGQLSLRAYSRTENTILGQTMRYGAGISFRKEFDNFKDFFKPKNQRALTKELEKELKKY